MTLGENRMDAIYRLVGLVILFTVVPILLTVGVVAALIWMVLDVIMELLTNGDGLTNSGRGADFLRRLFWWPINLSAWVLFGQGSFQWLP